MPYERFAKSSLVFTAQDHAYMARALQLTERGRDTATPNPNVGCIIVKNGRIIAQAAHVKAGEMHAEALALAVATASPEGATVYVTLEPCAHQGRTPPCADALVRAKVARVVAALEDPNPLVHGRGATTLRDAGIQVDIGLMHDLGQQIPRDALAYPAEARDQHRSFVRIGRPVVLAAAGQVEPIERD